MPKVIFDTNAYIFVPFVLLFIKRSNSKISLADAAH